MALIEGRFELRLAQDDADLRAAQRLRYEVFVAELGADGPLVDHDARLEADRFDPYFDHLMLIDHGRDQGAQVVGVYRLMRADQAARAGQFYSADEYDLGPLLTSERRVLELGRSCLHADYRGGTAMLHLWNGLARYVETHEIDILFGVASFPGTDLTELAAPLSLLHHRHLAPPQMRPKARPPHAARMDILPEDGIDRAAAVRAIPALIKAYLRLGGMVGEGAYLDHKFNCTDICLVLDTSVMSQKHRAIYTTRGGGGDEPAL